MRVKENETTFNDLVFTYLKSVDFRNESAVMCYYKAYIDGWYRNMTAAVPVDDMNGLTDEIMTDAWNYAMELSNDTNLGVADGVIEAYIKGWNR